MDIKTIWSASLSLIQKDINSVVGYNTYIKDITPISYTNEVFVIGVDNSICKNMIELRYADIIAKTISKIMARPMRLEIIINDEDYVPIMAETQEQIMKERAALNIKSNLNPRYTFDNFVVGPSNEYATAIAMSTAKYPGQEKNNPLFLYGNSGLGKTHLMQAIGNEILKNSPEM